MNASFLLRSKTAISMYERVASQMPIIDFHNHLSVSDIANDRKYCDLGELWLASDPYKHRLMRICGVEERYITGDADPYEKFEKYCTFFPLFAGNPVYDWSRMELSAIFSIKQQICKENARTIWDTANEMLASNEFTGNAILSRFQIEYQSPVASLFDDLSLYDGVRIAPSLRADELLTPTDEIKSKLQGDTGVTISDTDSYIRAVAKMLDRFDRVGCKFADHALDADFFKIDDDGSQREILRRLAAEYAKRDWTLLLHLDAKRKTSPRLAKLAGPAGGYAGVGGGFSISSLCDLLGEMEAGGGLPDTVLFPLNMNDQAPLAVLQGSFAEDGVASKVQLGPAWWWCDHALGIENTLSCIASFGVVSQFIGMTTDSRSILSFVRHDYFRRLLCTWLDEQNIKNEWRLSSNTMDEILAKICYRNALDKIQKS